MIFPILGGVMGKILEIEFEGEVSLDEIKEEMEFYRKNGQVVMTVINGEKVYSGDPDFHNIFERLKMGLSKEEYDNYKNTKEEINKLDRCIVGASSIENFAYYRYYFGLALKYVKSEKIDDFFDLVINNFSNYSNAFILATQLMLVINNSEFDIYVQINNILNSYRVYRGKDFFEYGLDVDKAIMLVKEYGTKGSLIDVLFFKNSTLEYVKSCQDRLEVLERKLK
jgi:hypothetical protein